MQEKLTIARPYAAAAFEYAEAKQAIEAWADMLESLATAVSDETLSKVIKHPGISDQQLAELMGELLGARLDDAGSNFVSVLIAAERLELAPQIAELFERRRAKQAGVVNVDVSSAFELDDSERSKIEAAIKSRVGQQCQIESSVDKTLIGGAVIKIGDAVIDLSLRGRLAALEQQLA